METTLSLHPWLLKERYGVVVIGSGYGGSVSLARLAQAGFSVCLLERGKEWDRNFPIDFEGVAAEVRTADNPTGLYDYQPGHDLDVFSGNGLGGTSLINANVAIRPTQEVFARSRWPTEIRAEAASGKIFDYYDRAAKTLLVEEARPRPGDSQLPRKVLAHKKSSGGPGFSLVHIAVNHDVDGENVHGVAVKPCNFCGDCVSGCNVGAKGTLAMNYLPLAKKAGAEIYTRVDVRYVLEAPGGGYNVFVRYMPMGGGDPVDARVHANMVIVSAGALGSTAVLLRSRDRGLSLSAKVGHNFSSNGDQLGIGYNCNDRIDSFGADQITDQPLPFPVGPTIMSVIDYRNDPQKDYIIEEGAFPRPIVDVLRKLAWEVSKADGTDTDAGFFDEATEISRIVSDQLHTSERGALNYSQVYLGMGHDDADGRVNLDAEGRPRVIWGGAGDKPVFDKLSNQMLDLVTALGGTYVKNPRWVKTLGHNPVTVHPLGGCPMGDSVDSGVVDHRCLAFRQDGTLHTGLYVVDGSVIPTSVGVNPFLTISAMAERAAEFMVAEQSKEVSKTPLAEISKVTEPEPGLEFTEKMRGFVTRRVTDATAADLDGYREAEKIAQADESPLEFRLTIVTEDLPQFIDSAEHVATCEGYVDSKLFGTKLLVEEGSFNLFIEDAAAHTKRMLYKLKFTGEDGQKYLLDGFKEIKSDLDIWADTTTLFTSIRAGWSTTDPIIAQGIIHVHVTDFLEQLTTFRIRNVAGAEERAEWLGKFGKFFFGDLWDTYIVHHVPGVGGAR